MRLKSLLLLPAFLGILGGNGKAFADEPSLEDLETLGENLEAEGAGQAPVPAQAPADVVPAVKASERPATDANLIEAIDIRSQIKKISEPNIFAGAAPNPGTLRNLATGEAPEEYAVQEGDTLFDICDQLIDEPNYWPKLWAFNPTIMNPHFVYPGMRLRFYSGDSDNPPFLQVVTEDDILPVAKGKIVESELVREDISGMLMRSEIPDQMKIVSPEDLDRIGAIDNMFMTVGGDFHLATKDVLIPAFVVDADLEVLGTVIGGSAGSILVDSDQAVIVKDVQGLQVGTTYSVVRKGETVMAEGKGRIGTRYEFIAQVKLNVEDKVTDDVFKGNVVFNRSGIQPGDILVSYRSVKRKVPSQAVAEGKGLEQTIVGFSEPTSNIGGRGDFVFIEQVDGRLNEKETYTIIQDVGRSAMVFLKGSLPKTDSNVAKVYILDSSGAAALGYLLHDSFEVRLGDRIAP